MDIRYSKMIKWVRDNHPTQLERLLDSLSPNQIICKKWLIESLDDVVIPLDNNGQFRVEIIGGWFGYPLIQMLKEKYPNIREIDIFEIDQFACRAINHYNKLFEYDNVRIFHQDYFIYQETRRTHMIINTSCEHMWDMSTNKEFYESPERTLLVLQSNNKRDEPDHINCIDHPKELVAQADMDQVWGGMKVMKSGEKEFYNRYMAMGKWK
jgi:hypothetical protein